MANRSGGFGTAPIISYECSAHLSGACATAVADCNDAPGTGQATVANCCNPTANTWTFQTCSFSEFFLGLTAGDLIPGKGSPATDCAAEWSVRNPLNDPFADRKGLPNFKQACTDDDPTCDVDGTVNGSCTIEVAACLNVNAPRLKDRDGAAACMPTAADTWLLKRPKPDSAKPTEAATPRRCATRWRRSGRARSAASTKNR